ncbi:endoplasmic reticulum aminopeptidase 1 [Ambystoma mexicanum]|uniref:endoplasmic reticulum aminopeptidase 1 n=1 Tax=Ambystoma mexicanum TaxID=8296 RepID=UPI0037E9A9B7
MMAKCTQPRFTTYMMICYLSSIPVQMNCASVNHEQPNDNQEASFPDSSSGSPFPWNKMRLPDHVVPLYYELLIHPNLTTLTFTGTTKIGLTIKRSTNAIVLHSKHLEITSAAIKRATGNYQLEEPTVLEYLPNDQIALLTTEPLLTGQNYSVTISYAANFSKSFHGFYISRYRNQDGEVRVLASTQFEPVAARMAFPCFDEPAFKANFSVKIWREPRHIALSNMPIVKSVNIADGLIEDNFAVSVKMSTYLVAFIVSDFKSVSKMSRSGVKVSVYAAPEQIYQADYALDAAVKLLEFYEDYFSIAYPLPKQDLVAIPDFQSGAMENWGLTTYRESALLFDPETSSASNKLWITMIVAHELAHQWFGNLVTMEWWNDLWLNEGFAKFMEFVSVTITHPDLQAEDTFLSKCFDAMEVDALLSSHPVSTPVENPAQIKEMFDDVSYDKGACILNMLRDYMSADRFQAGIKQYLHRYSYRNTKNEDLWNSMTDICPTDQSPDGLQQLDGFCSRNQQKSHWLKGDILDVKTMMNTWTLQKGFPLITVKVNGKQVHLQQEHYLKGSNATQATGYLWHVPLTYTTSNSYAVNRFLLKTKTDVLILPDTPEWIKFNVGMNGYYIVHYEGDGWDALINLLKNNHTAISSNGRASLINNAFLLVSAGRLPIDKAMDLTLFLKHESKIMPVFQGMSELVSMYKLMEKREMEDVENRLKAYIVNLFKSLIDRQSWSDDGTVSERMLRSSLLHFACVRKYQPCVDKAEDYFKKWRESNGTLRLPRDVKMAVYATGAQHIDGWDFLFQQYKTSLNSAEKNQIEFALAFTRNKDKLQWLMEQSLLDDHVKTQDLPHIVLTVGRNPFGYSLAWQFFKKNWDTFVQKFDLGSRSIAHMVTGLTNQYSTKAKLEEVNGFFESLKENGSQLRCVQQAKETIVENIRWMDENLERLKIWLEDNSSENTE